MSNNDLLMITDNVSMLRADSSSPGVLIPPIKRSDFPKDFVFGAAASAYQVEGAWNVHGKGRSNWDVFTMSEPGGIMDGSNGCTAIDQYNLFKEDVDLMKKLGLDSYRFSIAWTRILPGGRICKGICKEGIKYYNDLIDTLLASGIEPCVTLFHWDVPECLELEYQGFLSHRIVKDYCEFAEVCFWNFGDRVKRWLTLNEPWSFTVQGYVLGKFPPNRGSTDPNPDRKIIDLINFPIHRSAGSGTQTPITDGNPGTEPYIVAHHLILAHANAVEMYRSKYQETQRGQIGVTNVAAWFVPYSDKDEDKEAASRAIQFMLGWFIEPLVTGDYPPAMRKNVKERLPTFKVEEELLVKGSYDFLGINYYTTYYAMNIVLTDHTRPNYLTDERVEFATERDGIPIGPKAGSDWLYIVPLGIYELMLYAKKRYKDPIIYITENGVDEKNHKNKNITSCLSDEIRIKYHNDHLWCLKTAMQEKNVRVKGYYVWSLFDSYEWCEGYSVRFGLFSVDYENGRLTRFPKKSALWWMQLLDKNLAKKQAQESEEGRQGSVKRSRIAAN